MEHKENLEKRAAHISFSSKFLDKQKKHRNILRSHLSEDNPNRVNIAEGFSWRLVITKAQILTQGSLCGSLGGRSVTYIGLLALPLFPANYATNDQLYRHI